MIEVIMLDSKYIKTSLREDGDELITAHYINEVLPQTKQFSRYTCDLLMNWVNGSTDREPLAAILSKSKGLNEAQTESALIRPILESLGNSLIPQVAIGSDTMDFCVFDGVDFNRDYTNTLAVVESKHYGRIESQYYVRKEDNSDIIYQCLNYLRTINLTLNNHNSNHKVEYVVLTDGFVWRIYSKKYTHNQHEFETHFIEFNLENILNCQDTEERDYYLKLFGLFLCRESFDTDLLHYQEHSSELQVAVTQELREQTFMALEYIATGIWRKIFIDDNPIYNALMQSNYNIDVEEAKVDEDIRADLLKIVYDESIVFLLRLLFVLYAEDRNLFNEDDIPKIIKGRGNILEVIVNNNKAIGQIDNDSVFERNDDLALGKVFTAIDKKYNGGLFSRKKHPLLYELDIEDTLFARAIDNLCRVEKKKHIYTVDFSTISVRELGGIYETLLEYKLAILDHAVSELPSIINSKRIRFNVNAGDLYLINHKGERKATGSYYTPDLIVEHLVATALVPKLLKVKKDHNEDFDEFFKAITEIKVCDPAMGSGHMLQSAFSTIVDFVHQTLEEMHNDGTSHYSWNTETAYTIRAQVARKCIYGVDLNPIAVELAKLVMWMKVFRSDKPFEFLDYNLTVGNSLIGTYEYSFDLKNVQNNLQLAFLPSHEEMESNVKAYLLVSVLKMMDMKRETVDDIHTIEKFWSSTILPAQRTITLLENVKLAKWLMPEKKSVLDEGYDTLLSGINSNDRYAEKVIANDSSIPEVVKKLYGIALEIESQFHPIHWNIVFPHVAAKGGFDVVLSNPPWDRIKPTRGEFFADYIEGYDHLETEEAKHASEALMQKNDKVKRGWEKYENNIKVQDKYYQEAYKYQVVQGADGKKLKGDNNLYKIFIEKINMILSEDGNCGIVIPDNINIDSGCTGLRRMLFNNVTIKELIMFENRKRLFSIHGQYKFDVLTFTKRKARDNSVFDAGFYWYDPIWLDGKPNADYIKQNAYNKPEYHTRYKYQTRFIRDSDPDKLIIYEFRNKTQLGVFEKVSRYKPIGETNENFHIRTYNEFHMTNDADLFYFDGIGWPLYQGGMIHHFNAHYKGAEKYVHQFEGEERLSSKWKQNVENLPDRTYRIVCRSIAQPTDTRSLICTVMPRGSFFGNSLNAIECINNGNSVTDYSIIAGVNVVLSSFVADFFIRQRIAKNVNAFILQALPLPRDIDVITKLGILSMPLYEGDDFDSFRNGVQQIADQEERGKLIAKLDAGVAHLYKLTYEEYQSVLSTFPLVDEKQRKRCLQCYNDWTFSGM